MGFFYFDESIHPKGKFALGCFVYSETSLESPVSNALFESGLVPKVDEFKSGARMDRNPKQARARELLKETIYKQCGIGVVIAPDSPRKVLGAEAPLGLRKILSTIKFRSKSHEVFFDKGIFENESKAKLQADQIPSTCPPCNFHFEQDSVQVPGLQVADLVAHTCAMMLLAQLGLLTKTVKAGENSGYNPDLDLPLAFGFWAGLRCKFFAAPPPPMDSWKSQLDYQVDVASRGLHIADSCASDVRDAALARFGSMYLGCIH
jgi:hypothetical protein